MADSVKLHPRERFPADTSPYLSEPSPEPGPDSVGPRKKIIEEDLR
jgi:hypothetical protein